MLFAECSKMGANKWAKERSNKILQTFQLASIGKCNCSALHLLYTAHQLLLPLTLSLTVFSAFALPLPLLLCKVLRRTRTIIIKTKMFKIHFLSPLLHPLTHFVARCHLSCAFASPPLLLLLLYVVPFFSLSPQHCRLARSPAHHARVKRRRNENEVGLPGMPQWAQKGLIVVTVDTVGCVFHYSATETLVMFIKSSKTSKNKHF